LLIIALGQLVSKFEKWSKFEGLYWCLITATIVGYGDIRPLHRSSRMLAVVIALTGLILTGIIIAIAIHTVTIVVAAYMDPHLLASIQKRL